MISKLKEKLSVLLAKSPGKAVVVFIFLINLLFLVVATLIISSFSVTGTENMSFWEAAYYTITMILDAGCIGAVVQDIGTAGVATVIACLVVVILGMVLFTGAVIGYVTNFISDFIASANGGNHRLYMSDHTVIINWNSRASEIVNDLLYKKKKQKVVILVSTGKEEILKELEEHLAGTIHSENKALKQSLAGKPYFVRKALYQKNKLKNNVLLIVREGDPFSTKQLLDASVAQANTIIILNSDLSGVSRESDREERKDRLEKGNQLTIKTLMQVACITGDAKSKDDQKIVVEIEDDWTLDMVNMIIRNKQVAGKCSIVPLNINKVLGRLLSQFSIMPELNVAYFELLSNKGVTFYAKEIPDDMRETYVEKQLQSRLHSIPLTSMIKNGKTYGYFVATEAEDNDVVESSCVQTDLSVSVNQNYTLARKNVIILGHNSKIRYIMDGFDSFRNEWNDPVTGEVMNILVVDDKEHLEQMNYYKDYPYVVRTVEAELRDKARICCAIEDFVEETEGSVSLLILSDDLVPYEKIDSDVIAKLIYLRELINSKWAAGTTKEKIDIVVEIMNPKHYETVKNYNVENIVISNRYVSKMVAQLGAEEVLFDFYRDILSYDESGDDFISKEVYVKKVKDFFDEIPPEAPAADLIRAIFHATTVGASTPKAKTHTILLGYVKANGEIDLFGGDQRDLKVSFSPEDKIIVFADH